MFTIRNRFSCNLFIHCSLRYSLQREPHKTKELKLVTWGNWSPTIYWYHFPQKIPEPLILLVANLSCVLLFSFTKCTNYLKKQRKKHLKQLLHTYHFYMCIDYLSCTPVGFGPPILHDPHVLNSLDGMSNDIGKSFS